MGSRKGLNIAQCQLWPSWSPNHQSSGWQNKTNCGASGALKRSIASWRRVPAIPQSMRSYLYCSPSKKSSKKSARDNVFPCTTSRGKWWFEWFFPDPFRQPKLCLCPGPMTSATSSSLPFDKDAKPSPMHRCTRAGAPICDSNCWLASRVWDVMARNFAFFFDGCLLRFSFFETFL